MTLGPNWERTERERDVCLALEKVAQEVGAKSITAGENRTTCSLLSTL